MSVKKRILFISHLANRTGAPLALCTIIQTIKSQCNIDCDIMIMRDGELRKEFELYGKVFQGWNNKSIIHKIGRKLGIERAKYNYLNVVKSQKYDLVYANTAFTLPIAKHIKEVLHIPYILHLHESSHQLCLAGVTHEDLLDSEFIVTVSRFAADSLIKDYDYPPNKIIISHPFSELAISLLKRDVEFSLNRRSKIFNIGLAGSGYWLKSIDRLPMLMDIFYSKYPTANCQFVWVGEVVEEEERRLVFELQKFNMIGKLILTGKVDNPQDYFKRFDIFLLLSREDSFPLVALENAALCKPVICFDNCSGAVEWVKKGAGDAIPYMQLSQLADIIYKYYSDNDYRIRIGMQARHIVQKIYDESVFDNRISDAVLDLLSVNSL